MRPDFHRIQQASYKSEDCVRWAKQHVNRGSSEHEAKAIQRQRFWNNYLNAEYDGLDDDWTTELNGVVFPYVAAEHVKLKWLVVNAENAASVQIAERMDLVFISLLR